MHNLKIKSDGSRTDICLDDFKMQGITGYEVKSLENNTAEIIVKLIVCVNEIGN